MRFGIVLAVLLVLSVHDRADAQANSKHQILCKSAAGALSIRTKYTKSETRLTFDEFTSAAFGAPPSGTVIRGSIGSRIGTKDTDSTSQVTLVSTIGSLPQPVIAAGVSDGTNC